MKGENVKPIGSKPLVEKGQQKVDRGVDWVDVMVEKAEQEGERTAKLRSMKQPKQPGLRACLHFSFFHFLARPSRTAVIYRCPVPLSDSFINWGVRQFSTGARSSEPRSSRIGRVG